MPSMPLARNAMVAAAVALESLELFVQLLRETAISLSPHVRSVRLT